MPNPLDISNIPAPRVDFIDPRTGLMAREWYRFFFNLFNLTGGGSNDTSLSDLQIGPPPINSVLGEINTGFDQAQLAAMSDQAEAVLGQLGIVYDQAQLAAMIAQYEQATLNLQNQFDTLPSRPELGTIASYNLNGSPTAGGVSYGTGSAVAFTPAGTSGQFLTSAAAGVPTWSSPSSVAVTSFSAGTTGLTPATATTGAVTLAGTLVVANGGTGATTLTGYVYGNGTGAMTASTSIPATVLSGTIAGDRGVTAGSTSSSFVEYNGTTATAGQFDGGTTAPTGSTRLNYGGWFYPTFINLVGSADTATAATHYFVETATDGFVRPKTIANVRTEIVTNAAVLAGIGTLPVTNGGTGTATAFTTGSVVFAGASGVYLQDNAQLFWNDTNNRLGVGTAAPAAKLHVLGGTDTTFSPNVFNTRLTGDASATSGNSGSGISFQGYTTGTTSISDLAFVSGIKENITDTDYAGALVFGTRTNGSGGGNFERMRIDSSGYVLAGTSSAITGLVSRFTNAGTTADTFYAAVRYVNSQAAPGVRFGKSRGATVGAHAALVSGDRFGEVQMFGSDGTNFVEGGKIWGEVDGAVSLGVMPGRLTFYTTPAGTGTATEKMRIDNAGNVGIGTASPASPLDVVGQSNLRGFTRVQALAQSLYGQSANLELQDTAGYAAFPEPGVLFSGYYNNVSNIVSFANISAIKANSTDGDASANLKFCVSNTTAGSLSEAMRIQYDGNVGIGSASPAYKLDVAGTVRTTNQFISTQANSTTTGGGQIYLNGATGNRIDFSTAGTNTPTFTTRSIGTKLVLYPSVDALNTDYALGIASGVLWNSVPGSTRSFVWYAGTTIVFSVKGNGEVVSGNGDTSAAPVSAVYRATDGVGTNIAGANLSIQGGRGTGAGAGGYVRFLTAPAGTTGTTLGTATERLRIDSAGNVGIGTATNLSTLTVNGSFASKSPSSVNAATYTVAATDGSLRFTTTNCTVTLPAASSFPGRILYLNTITANSVTSASANVIPLGSNTAGTAILAATLGKFAMIQSDGTNWITMMAN